jgi:membrane protein implicated in regulation of membrane protease activity
MDFLSPVWLWMYAGAFLMLAELASPGFVVFFFGLAAATVSMLKWIFPALPLWGQLAAFSVLSILYLLVLRKYLKKVFTGDKQESPSIDNEYIGRVGRVVEVVRPDVPGRILLGDAEWTAKAATRLEPGTEVRVVAQENLTLAVEPI